MNPSYRRSTIYRRSDRSFFPGNGGTTGIDVRQLAFRHGKLGQRLAGGMRLNAVFYDGHAETLLETDSTNPKYWLPSGSQIVDTSKLQPDVQARFGLTSASTSNPWVVP